MAEDRDWTAKLANLPDAPGVYLFKDAQNKIIYVGKASSLSKRVRSYFQKTSRYLKQNILMAKSADLEYLVTTSEAEALILESNLIKAHQPRYNVQLKDDKAYPYLKITLNEDFPRLTTCRRVIDDGAKYFGPYPHISDLKRTLRLIKQTFAIRTCKYKLKASKPISPCLNFHIKRCVAPCGGMIDKRGYEDIVKSICLFLDGGIDELIEELTLRMKAEAQGLRFEEAARIRDQISGLKRIGEQASSLLIQKITTEEKPPPLLELQGILNLSTLPRCIEAFDVSNISGKGAVGSLVVFKDGQPKKNEYRRFRIKSLSQPNDPAMLSEIVNRRYSRLLKERRALPDLVMLDGGKTQLSAVWRVFQSLGLDELPLIGLAKPQSKKEGTDRIITINPLTIIPLTQGSAACLLLQHIRDEAHRFALSYHRQLRRNFCISE